jgi:hypothetical protein
MSCRSGSSLGTGLVLIAIGVIFLASRLHLTAPVDLARLWPVILIVLGFGRLVARTDDGRHLGGLTTMLIGVIFLLHTYRIFTIDQSWPLFLVVGGLSLVLSSRYRDRRLGAKP